MLWEHLLLPENNLVHSKAEAARTHLLQPSLLAGVFSVSTVRFTEQESCDLCLLSLHQVAARQRLVPRTNFSF